MKRAVSVLPEDAGRLVKPGMWLDHSCSIAQPDAFDRALAAKRDLKNTGTVNLISNQFWQFWDA
jgi:hypothetical protein